MFIKKSKTEPHSLINIYNTFVKIATTSGTGSSNVKEGLLLNMMLNATKDEIKYLVRFAQKSLKINASEATM
jgi:DNA ligase-1